MAVSYNAGVVTMLSRLGVGMDGLWIDGTGIANISHHVGDFSDFFCPYHFSGM